MEINLNRLQELSKNTTTRKIALWFFILSIPLAGFGLYYRPWSIRQTSVEELHLFSIAPYFILCGICFIFLSVIVFNSKKPLIIGFLATVLVVFGSGLWLKQLNNQVMEAGNVITGGHITEKDEYRKRKSDGSTSYFFYVDYTAGSNRYTKKMKTTKGDHEYYKAGDSIQIRYARANPKIVEWAE